jgi:hypothetical protein
VGTPVAGPGQFSQRTDKAVGEANRSLPNADYGEQAQYQEQLQGAPMATDVTGMNFNDLFGNPANQVTGLNEESAMPDIPVTDGADAGAGAGSEVLSSSAQTPQIQSLAPYVIALEVMANTGKSDLARNLARQVKYSI